MAYYNPVYNYQPGYQMGYPYGCQYWPVQEWMQMQYVYFQTTLTCRVPGMIRPFYIHTPTMYVYEYPVLASVPIGMYSATTGMLNMYPSPYYNSFAAGYRSLPVEVPYSPAALALQGGKYPPTTMSVPNDLAYPVPLYSFADYNNPYRYGMFGQRGGIPGAI